MSASQKVLVLGGAGRGFHATAPLLASLQEQGQIPRTALLVDPVAHKLRAAESASLRLNFETAQAAAEVVATSHHVGVSVLQVDTPHVVVDVCRGQPSGFVFAAMIIAPPSGPLLGVFAAVNCLDGSSVRQVAEFFAAVGAVTAETGSDDVLGGAASPVHRSQVPAVRRQFSELLQRTLPQAMDGRSGTTPPLQLTRGGSAPEPLIVLPETENWRDAIALAEATDLARGKSVYRRGTAITVAEPSARDGVRLHSLSIRRADGRLAIRHHPLEEAAQSSAGNLLQSESLTLVGQWDQNSAVATSD